jgi:hypothetical protein
MLLLSGRMKQALFVVLLAAGCSDSVGQSVSDLEQQADSVNDCCEVAKSSLGMENHLVRLGSRVVLIHDWVKNAAGKYTGFSITVSNGEPMSYLVKEGTDSFSGQSGSWSTPDDRSISKINFCHECDNPDGCEGGDGGGGSGSGSDGGGDGSGSGCDNPDGCPDGGGSGHDLF